MTDPRQAAADLLAAMTNDEFAAFAAQSHAPHRPALTEEDR